MIVRLLLLTWANHFFSRLRVSGETVHSHSFLRAIGAQQTMVEIICKDNTEERAQTVWHAIYSGVKKCLPPFWFLFFFCMFVTPKCFRSNKFKYKTKTTQNAVFKMKVFIIKGKQNPNLHGPVWKSDCPLNLITGWATFSSNNCNQAFAITCTESYSAVEEFWPTHLCRIVVIQPHLRVFEHEPPFYGHATAFQ